MFRTRSMLAGALSLIPATTGYAQSIVIDDVTCVPLGSARLSVDSSGGDEVLRLDGIGTSWLDGVRLDPIGTPRQRMHFSIEPPSQRPIAGRGILMDVAGRSADGSVVPVLLRTAIVAGEETHVMSIETWWPAMVPEVRVELYLSGEPVGTVPFMPCPNEFHQFPLAAEICHLAFESWCALFPGDDICMPEPLVGGLDLVGSPRVVYELGQVVDVVFPSGERWRADEVRIVTDVQSVEVDHADIRVNSSRSLRISGIGLSGVCRADWNGDGGVNSQDFFEFLRDFFAGRADFDGNGTTNSQDFFEFLRTLFAGCD